MTNDWRILTGQIPTNQKQTKKHFQNCNCSRPTTHNIADNTVLLAIETLSFVLHFLVCA